jgi:nucleotide-binding universal stress UspA family protein
MTMAASNEQRGGQAQARAHTTAAEAPFHRLLVAVDGTEAGAGAESVAREWAQRFGGVVRRIELSRASGGAVVREVADAVADFGADVIVLGCDRRRLARHRLAHSLREQLTRATDLPVLVVPGARRLRALSVQPEEHEDGGVTDARRYARV